MNPTDEQIEKAKQTLIDAGYIIGSLFQLDDIHDQANRQDIELTETQILEVREVIDRTHDATVGVNWDVITCAIQTVIANS